jgi:putative ABC transport system permease protein
MRNGVDKVFFKILKKDLKRKKAMNIILFLFMITASMLVAGSVNMLYTTTNALDEFKKISKVSDNIIMTFSNKANNKRFEEWAKSSDKVKSVSSEDIIVVTADDITIPSEYGKFKDRTTLFLSMVPKQYNLVFNQNDEAFKLRSGEIALPLLFKENSGVQLGDKIKIKIGACEKELLVKHFTKDVVYGADMMGSKRIIINDDDFHGFNNDDKRIGIKQWVIFKNDKYTYNDVEKDFSKTSIQDVGMINSDIVTYTYMMDLITAGIMIIVSIFLICISLLILRFTIVFTIEEDYKEIGIMKAIGLKNKSIKSIYMVKYLTLSVIGGSLGLLASIPFADYLLGTIANHIMMTTTVFNYILSIISVIFIILMTIGFCYIFTIKINKLSAIDAIRQGSTGERFSISKKLKLHKMKHISAPLFLAFSDLVSIYKKFIILIITFILGTFIIIVPINIINTLNSDDIITLFGQSKIDFYVGANSFAAKYINKSMDILLKDLDDIEAKAKNNGIDIKLYPEMGFTAKVYADNPDESKSIYSNQAIDYSTDNYTYLSGKGPKLENEVAMTAIAAEYFGVGLGDTITCTINGKTGEFIITGIYQSMINLGYGLRFSEKHSLSINDCSSFPVFGLLKDKNIDKKEAVNSLKSQFPELDVKEGKEYCNDLMGSSINTLRLTKNIILVVVLGVNFLITCLLVRMLLAKEIQEIAVLKSTGFKDRSIRKWQIYRIAIVLIISVMLGTIIANLTCGPLSYGIFKMMGATKIDIVVEPLQVYVIYPIIILIVTMLAVLISIGQVRKTKIWEINNQE